MRAQDIIAVVIVVSVILAAGFLPRVGRFLAASMVCLFALVITLPNLGSVSLPNHKIGYGWKDALVVVVIFVPLIPIFIGARHLRNTKWIGAITEGVGWALMILLLGMCFL
jgi:uncharacterized membrane protein YphA (DoxX/SURF4 family)